MRGLNGAIGDAMVEVCSMLYSGESCRLSTSFSGMYGEITPNSFLKLIRVFEEYGMDEDSVFVDLGSGRGVPNLMVASKLPICASIGIEKCSHAYGQSINLLEVLIEKRSKGVDNNEQNNFSMSPIAFANADISAYPNFDGVTHFYSFDAAMEPSLVFNISQQFMTTSTALIYGSYNSDLIQNFNMRGVTLVKKVPVRMTGSGEGRICYFYAKDDWMARKTAGIQFLYYALVEPYGNRNRNDNLDKEKMIPSKTPSPDGIKLTSSNEPVQIIDLIRLARLPFKCLKTYYINDNNPLKSLSIQTRSKRTGIKKKGQVDKTVEREKILSSIAMFEEYSDERYHKLKHALWQLQMERTEKFSVLKITEESKISGRFTVLSAAQ